MRTLVDIVFPPSCLSCRARGVRGLCARCEQRVRWIDPRACCARCGAPAPAAMPTCGACRALRPAFTHARAAAVYDGPARDALIAFKLGGERRAVAALAAYMPSAHVRGDVVTFVPSTRRSTAARGFNPAEELARHVARAMGVRCLPLLCKVRETADQAGLSRSERAANLRGAFVARAFPSTTVVLVDDVLTTGSTANACSEALRGAGMAKIEVLTFARAI